MNLFLVGPKAVGKTTFGKKLSDELGYAFSDTDRLLEDLYYELTGTKKSFREIYVGEGVAYFRRLEEQVIDRLCEGVKEKQVVACGGGLLESVQNREILPKLGLIISLYLEPSKLYERWDRSIPFYDQFDEIVARRYQQMSMVSSVWLDVTSNSNTQLIREIVYGK